MHQVISGTANGCTPSAAPALNPPGKTTSFNSLSPSQVNNWLNCSFSWYCSKQLQLPDPPTLSLAIGQAVHRTVSTALRGKGAGSEVSTAELLADYAEPFIREELAGVPAGERDTATALARMTGMVTEWHTHALPRIQPVVVERPIYGTIAGVPVRGIVDCVDTKACIIDTKTSRKKPMGIKASHRLQLATYATLLELEDARTDTLVSNSRSNSYVPQSFVVTAEDRRFVSQIYPSVAAGIAAQLYTPNRASSLCSREFCRFWQACEKEWGGTVRD